MRRLDGKVVLITGTARGMGRAAALLFAREGAVVAGCDLDPDGAAETVEVVVREGGRMTSTAPSATSPPHVPGSTPPPRSTAASTSSSTTRPRRASGLSPS